jgi:hypothetical protein
MVCVSPEHHDGAGDGAVPGDADRHLRGWTCVYFVISEGLDMCLFCSFWGVGHLFILFFLRGWTFVYFVLSEGLDICVFCSFWGVGHLFILFFLRGWTCVETWRTAVVCLSLYFTCLYSLFNDFKLGLTKCKNSLNTRNTELLHCRWWIRPGRRGQTPEGLDMCRICRGRATVVAEVWLQELPNNMFLPPHFCRHIKRSMNMLKIVERPRISIVVEDHAVMISLQKRAYQMNFELSTWWSRPRRLGQTPEGPPLFVCLCLYYWDHTNPPQPHHPFDKLNLGFSKCNSSLNTR